MKKLTVMTLVAAMMMSLLTACGTETTEMVVDEEKAAEVLEEVVGNAEAVIEEVPGDISLDLSTEETEEAAETEETAETEEAEEADPFAEIIEFMTEGLGDAWADSDPSDMELSSVYLYNSPELGYLEFDINKDGFSELVIGENVGADGETMIYDIFTVDGEGTVYHVLSGGERDVFYVTDMNVIVEEGSNSADDSIVKGYSLMDAGALEELDWDDYGTKYTCSIILFN